MKRLVSLEGQVRYRDDLQPSEFNEAARNSPRKPQLASVSNAMQVLIA